MYNEYEIRTIPLSLKSIRQRVEKFLALHELKLDNVDYYAGIFRLDDDEILACGGLENNIIKCIAVNDDLQGTGMSNRLVSHLISTAVSIGYNSVKVFTKPKNKDIFTSLGFTLLAQSDKAVLLENNSKNINDYCSYLSSEKKDGINGCIVMNCNPFTLGHLYLIEQASRQVDNLYIIPVKEDKSVFSYTERKAMIECGVKHLKNVTVLNGSDYAISQATFPTYFLKNITDATDTHIQLDLDIFTKFIAPALNIQYRFVGSETTDVLTLRYNTLMKQILPENNIKVTEIKRLEKSGNAISASAVRNHLKNNSLSQAMNLVPLSDVPYLLSYSATQALQTELDLTPKPGLVDKKDSGSHKDMDYSLMCKSIKSLHPYFTQLALLGCQKDLPSVREIRTIGLKAEEEMFKTTNGINTHKGALFSMGLAVLCASHIIYLYNNLTAENLQSCISILASRFDQPEHTHGDEVLRQNKIKGALYNATDGYKELFGSWLPFYKENKDGEYCLHRLLLLIMSTLDDTNVYYRKNADTVLKVKQQAKELFDNFSIYELEKLNTEYIKENISSGGAADMLSLTIFIASVLN